MRPVRWLSSGARIALLIYAVAGVAALGLAQRAWMGGRVPKAFVTGRAAAAIGDSGVFASPVLPRGVRPMIPHADAESAAVAAGYRNVPSVQDVTALPEYKEIPLERRHFCGRSYYVLPIVAMPDTNVVRTTSGNDWGMWSPTWLMPICDSRDRVRSTVMLSDVPASGLHVILGDQPGDVPRLVSSVTNALHMGAWPSKFFPDWERGTGMTPETAVDVAEVHLRGTGARVTEVPQAFTLIIPPNALRRAPGDSQPFAPTAQCSRWRLALDRPVRLRGLVTGQVVSTATVYVTRGDDGCRGAPVLEIPKPSQPATLPVTYMVPRQIRDTVVVRGRGRFPKAPPVDWRWTRLRDRKSVV